MSTLATSLMSCGGNASEILGKSREWSAPQEALCFGILKLHSLRALLLFSKCYCYFQSVTVI